MSVERLLEEKERKIKNALLDWKLKSDEPADLLEDFLKLLQIIRVQNNALREIKTEGQSPHGPSMEACIAMGALKAADEEAK